MWYRFNDGLPNVMIWDMQIDRGSTTLSLWTRGRGAFVWPLPLGPIQAPVTVNSIVSRKMHGGAGTFDIVLDGGGIECRSGGATNDYTLVFTFANTLTNVSNANVTSGTGTVSSSNIGGDAHQYIVNLTGVTNVQQLTVTLNNVQDSAGHFSGSVPGTMKVLVGDTNGNSSVNSTDIAQTKAQLGLPVTGTNFRTDVNANGSINSTDVGLVKSNVGTSLP